MSDLDMNINEVIAHAVQAKIDAAVMAALSGDAVLGQMVTTALNQPIEVGGSYSKVKTTFLREALRQTMQQAVKDGLAKVVAEEQEQIEKIIRTEIRKQVPALAAGIAEQFVKSASSAYFQIKLAFPGQD